MHSLLLRALMTMGSPKQKNTHLEYIFYADGNTEDFVIETLVILAFLNVTKFMCTLQFSRTYRKPIGWWVMKTSVDFPLTILNVYETERGVAHDIEFHLTDAALQKIKNVDGLLGCQDFIDLANIEALEYILDKM